MIHSSWVMIRMVRSLELHEDLCSRLVDTDSQSVLQKFLENSKHTRSQTDTNTRLSLVLTSYLLPLLRLRLCLLGFLKACFRVGDRVATTGSEDKIGVLLLELCKVLLGGPHPWRVGFE